MVRGISRLPAKLLFVVALLLWPAAARAEDAPAAQPVASPPPPTLDFAETEHLASILAGEFGRSRLWYYGWAGFYGTVIAAELVINATSTGGAQLVARVNIATSLVGLFQTLIVPPPIVYGWEPVEKMPQGTPEQQAARAAAVRTLFEQEARNEIFYHSVLNHIVGLAANAGVCAFIYWGQHQGGRALLNLFGGSLVWEANIFTYPNAAMRAVEAKGVSMLQLRVVPFALPTGGAGAAVVGTF